MYIPSSWGVGFGQGKWTGKEKSIFILVWLGGFYSGSRGRKRGCAADREEWLATFVSLINLCLFSLFSLSLSVYGKKRWERGRESLDNEDAIFAHYCSDMWKEMHNCMW